MDLMRLCLVSMRAMMFGFVCVLRWDCRFNIVVCIPLVLRVRAVMAEWVNCTGGIVSACAVGFCVMWVGGRGVLCWGEGVVCRVCVCRCLG